MKMHKKTIRKVGALHPLSAAAAAGVLAAGLLLAAAPSARAQDTATLPTQNVSITLTDAPVRTALDALFKSTSLNYTIDPNIAESVTVTLHNVAFDVALKAILRSSTPELRYSVNDGVYKIYAPTADLADPNAANVANQNPGYPGGLSVSPGGGPNIAIGPNSNIGQSASASDTKQVVLIPLIYLPPSVLNYIVGPVQAIPTQAYTPGASSGNGVGGTGGIGGVGGIGGSSGGIGGIGGISGGIGGIGGGGGFGGGLSGGIGGIGGIGGGGGFR